MDIGFTFMLVALAITVYAAFLDQSPRGHRNAFFVLMALWLITIVLGL